MVLMLLDLSAWVLLAGLVAGELYLFLIRDRPIWLRIGYFVLLGVIWFTRLQFFEDPTVAETMYPRTFAGFLLVISILPVTFFAIGIELASKLQSRYAPHVALAILTLAIALVWPSFALMLHCGLLECF